MPPVGAAATGSQAVRQVPSVLCPAFAAAAAAMRWVDLSVAAAAAPEPSALAGPRTVVPPPGHPTQWQ